MSLSAGVLRKMLEKGLTLSDAVEIAEAWEVGAGAPVPDLAALNRRAYDRDRMRRKREDEAAIRRQSADMSADSPPTPAPSETKRPPHPQENSTPSKNPPMGVKKVPPEKPLSAFAAFWSAYPAKVGKRDAAAKFDAAVKRIGGADPPAVILAGLERAKRSKRWRDGFIPNPSTWLYQDRWEDDPESRPPPPQPAAQSPPDPTAQLARLQHFRDTGEWKPAWGDKPTERAA